MAEERLQRRLAAILSADVVGYSRLMGIDEAGTLSRLNALRRELIDPTIAAHSGRIVKLMGDGALVEFASAVDAVTCAIEIQRKATGPRRRRSEADPIRFRIGINVGDIIIEGDDILGDGVTSRRGSKESPSLAASLFPRTLGDKFRGRSRPTSSMPASRASRTSPNPYASIASNSAEKVCRNTLSWHYPISRRSPCCHFRI